MQKVLSPVTYVCSHWMFFPSPFISASTVFDFLSSFTQRVTLCRANFGNVSLNYVSRHDFSSE